MVGADPAQPILGDVRESARFAEQAGLDSIWSTDHLVASAPMLDSTVALATAAAVTSRIAHGDITAYELAAKLRAAL